MIYFFMWDSDFLVKQEVSKWKQHFLSKFWDFNLLHIKNIEEMDNNFLTLNLTSTSFLADKKMIIIDITEQKKSNDWTDKISKIDELRNIKLEFLTTLLDKIPEGNILLIDAVNPSKKSKFYKSIIKLAEVKEFNDKVWNRLSSVIKDKYGKNLSTLAIETLIKYKSWNLNKIISEIEKLLITHDYIDKKEVVENIIPELEENIFQIIDDLLNKDAIQAINKIDILLNYSNIYAFYNFLVSNLRTNMYISKLKNLWINSREIWQILDLWNRSFLVDKKYKLGYNELKKFYINLINADKTMKSGRLHGTEEWDLYYEIQRIIIKMM